MSETADSAPSNADELGDTKNAKMRRYDDIYDSHVRSFGPYQRVLYLIMKLLIIPISAQFTALVFCLGTPEFQCTTANVTCPPRKCCDNCTSYEFVGPFTTSVSEVRTRSQAFKLQFSSVARTHKRKWNLICDRGYIGASLQAVFFAGMMIGSVISGMMADAWGRKPCIFACTTLMCSCYHCGDVLAKFGGKKGQNVDTESLRGLLEQIKEDQLKMQMKEKRYGLPGLSADCKVEKVVAYHGLPMDKETVAKGKWNDDGKREWWFVVAFVNFGLYLYLSQLAGDIYVNYAVTRSIATIAIPLDYIFLAKFGRRSYHGVYAIIGGTSLLIILAVNEKYPMATTILTILSIIIGPNWGTVYLITAELYPTVLRNSALGTGSLIGRIGGTIAPYFTMIWNLICDRGYIGASLQAVFFAGMMIGSVISGMMADAWGRKPCIFACTTLMALTSAGSAYADCISLFALLRFLLGIGLTGVMLSSFVYSLELVGPKRRTLISALTGIFWAGGGLLNLLESYFIRDWRLLLFVYSIPAVLLLPLWRFIPESPRWLMLHGRLDGSLDVLAKFGGKKGQNVDTESLRGLLEQIKEDQLKMQMKEKRYGLLDLAQLPGLSMTFPVTVFGLSAIIAGAMTYLLPETLFAKMHQTIEQTEAAEDDYSVVCCGAWLQGTACVVYCVARFVAVGAWFQVDSKRLNAQLPGLSMTFPVTVFGLSAIIAGAMTYLLPETLFAKMHQTIEQTEAAEDDYSVVCCGKPLTRHKQTKAQAVEFKDGVVLTNFETVQNKGDQATIENGL
ncbi:predicted protein [Nematostella vectensis]|uniref:Major facilitator superfamily (MFS) profile domain-containing protein n=1 Tax=Nematostella vectensis TaxID=45351 RepID=A7S7F7_NEMVE|nr:predicted protein [Nematostella vectensis]|eukprot:XP_001632477.1 predicted protein [Nematostella vectensis]